MEIACWSVDPGADVVSNFETDWFAAFQGFRTRLPQFPSTRQNPFSALLTFTKATMQAQKKAARTKGIIFQSILVCWDVLSEFVVFWSVDHDVTLQQSTINKLFRSRRLTSPKLRWRTFPGTSAGRVCCGSRYSSTFFDLNLPKHEICSIGATVLAAWKWYGTMVFGRLKNDDLFWLASLSYFIGLGVQRDWWTITQWTSYRRWFMTCVIFGHVNVIAWHALHHSVWLRLFQHWLPLFIFKPVDCTVLSSKKAFEPYQQYTNIQSAANTQAPTAYYLGHHTAYRFLIDLCPNNCHGSSRKGECCYRGQSQSARCRSSLARQQCLDLHPVLRGDSRRFTIQNRLLILIMFLDDFKQAS